MSDERDDVSEETLAMLYVLGHLQGEERQQFEALLKQEPSTCEHRARYERLVEALSWSIAPRQAPSRLRARLLQRVHQEKNVGIGQWRETSIAGIRLKPLFIDIQARRFTALVAMAMGSVMPPHRHADSEELFMLSGDACIAGRELQAEDYIRSEAGSEHEAIHTRDGCRFIVLSSLDDVFFPGNVAPVRLGEWLAGV